MLGGGQVHQHIAHCPALLNQCFEGEHEDLITEYEQKEAELAGSAMIAP